ncbi:T9SS type A sorting domain-containing protein [candidate division KSB1 bacterium]|nr:T9SS type A sorting domain-containing protein [candidate division KSB1 bacterium]
MRRSSLVCALLVLFTLAAVASGSGIERDIVKVQPLLTLISPNGGEIFSIGKPIEIHWGLGCPAPACTEIWLSTDGGLSYPILLNKLTKPTDEGADRGLDGYTSCCWVWPAADVRGDHLRIKVRGVSPLTVLMEDMSDKDFVILPKRDDLGALAPAPRCAVDGEHPHVWAPGWYPASPSGLEPGEPPPQHVVLLSPNGCEVYDFGAPVEITWLSKIALHACLEITLSTDGGKSFPIFLTHLDWPVKQTSWTWNNHQYFGSNLKIMLTYYCEKFVCPDMSDMCFTIRDPGTGDGPPTSLQRAPGLVPAPNPFNAMTRISYAVASPGTVNMTIHDLGGRVIAELLNGWQDAGEHAVSFNAAGLASGTYFCRLTTPGNVTTTRLELLK